MKKIIYFSSLLIFLPMMAYAGLIFELKEKFTILIVTHNMQQAARVSDYTAFMYMGDLIEYTDTDTLFTNPSQKQTEDYITGRFG